MSKYFLKDYIKDLRTQSGLSQKDFADAVGIGFSTLKQAELGNTSLLNSESVKALAKYTKTNELEVLKNIIYYDCKDFFAVNPDANALALYTCYLYKQGYALLDEVLILSKKQRDYIFFSEKLDKEAFILAYMPMKIEDPKRNLGLQEFLGYGSSLTKNNNPVQIKVPFITDLKLKDLITKPQIFSAYATMMANSLPKIYKQYKSVSPRISFVFAYDEKTLNKMDLKKLFVTKTDNRVIYNVVLFDNKTYKFKELYSAITF